MAMISDQQDEEKQCVAEPRPIELFKVAVLQKTEYEAA